MPAPRLEPDEIDELLERYHATGDRGARNRVVEAHLSMVGFQVRRFSRGSAASAEDVRQTALMAIIQAAERYRPGRGASFRTFAARTIEGELKRYLRDRSWAVRPPRGRQELHLVVSRTSEELGHELGRSPTVDEVAERAGLHHDQVLEGIEAGHARVADTLDRSRRGEDGEESPNPFGGDDPSFVAAEHHMDLRAALTGLGERDRAVLHLRFIDELSQPEIAERLGISQSYVSRILRNAVTHLRDVMEGGEGQPLAGARGPGPEVGTSPHGRLDDAGSRSPSVQTTA